VGLPAQQVTQQVTQQAAQHPTQQGGRFGRPNVAGDDLVGQARRWAKRARAASSLAVPFVHFVE